MSQTSRTTIATGSRGIVCNVWSDAAREASAAARKAGDAADRASTRANQVSASGAISDYKNHMHQKAAMRHTEASRLHSTAGDQKEAERHLALAKDHYKKGRAESAIGDGLPNDKTRN